MTRYGLRVPVFFLLCATNSCYAPIFVMRHRNIVMRIMKKLAHYKKMGTLQKNGCITKKWAHYKKMGALQKNGRITKKWVHYKKMGALQKNGHITKKWAHYKKMGTLQKNGRITKNGRIVLAFFQHPLFFIQLDE